jgi:hypothetical protein
VSTGQGTDFGWEEREMILLVDQHRRTLPPAYQLASEDPRNAKSPFGIDCVIVASAKHRLINASLSVPTTLAARLWSD